MTTTIVKRVQTLANKLAAMERRRLKRRGEWRPDELSYEEHIAAARSFAAAVLRRWRADRPQTLRRLVRSDAI